MRLTDLLNNLAELPVGSDTIQICGMKASSSKVIKGDIFFALQGTIQDGRDFIDDAVERGASVILTDERPFSKSSNITVPVVQVNNPRKVMAMAAKRFWPKQPSFTAAITGTNRNFT